MECGKSSFLTCDCDPFEHLTALMTNGDVTAGLLDWLTVSLYLFPISQHATSEQTKRQTGMESMIGSEEYRAGLWYRRLKADDRFKGSWGCSCTNRALLWCPLPPPPMSCEISARRALLKSAFAPFHTQSHVYSLRSSCIERLIILGLLQRAGGRC